MSDPTFSDRVNAELEKMGADPLTPAQADALDYEQDYEAGLPQSEHGGLHPELRARITAARAAIGDYELGPHPDQVAWMMQADRLAAELRSLLEVIERHSA